MKSAIAIGTIFLSILAILILVVIDIQQIWNSLYSLRDLVGLIVHSLSLILLIVFEILLIKINQQKEKRGGQR